MSLATTRPLVGISVVIMGPDRRILLGKRKGSHGEGQYSTPGGHLEHGEGFHECARREVLEETGLVIDQLWFLRVLNSMEYAPKHYVDIAFAARWQTGKPRVCEPDKVERWDWFDPRELPSPLFTMVPSAIEVILNNHVMPPVQSHLHCKDLR